MRGEVEVVDALNDTGSKKITRLLVANRGEIACRIFRTCRALGIQTVAVYSEADAEARHVREADVAIPIGGSRPDESYLRVDAILDAARQSRADAVHPGYGFLSEDPRFAREVARSGLTWIGPHPDSMIAMADKVRARTIAHEAGVPVVPGEEVDLNDEESTLAAAVSIGFPLMVKAAEGGGGIGMTVVHSEDQLAKAVAASARRAEAAFGSDRLYLEKYIASARHIEVQVMGDSKGRSVVLGDRDCTIQRRHQKVLEEAPAPGLTQDERRQLHRWACDLADGVGYFGAGTIEMIFDLDERQFYFLEMNTRLQVEHPVTELVTGLDLVEMQIAVAQGTDLGIAETPEPRGHAFEFRVCAEDPERFFPSPGTIVRWKEPTGEGIRIDSGVETEDVISPFYDSLMAKLCAHSEDRQSAMALLQEAAAAFTIEGPRNNLPLVPKITRHDTFINNHHTTNFLSEV